jgi:hypothetical protein
MLLHANPNLNLLLGSYDESAAVQYIAGMREHQFKKEHVNSLDIFRNKTDGCIQGEGSAFFDLSGEPSTSTWCSVQGIQLIYRPDSPDELMQTINSFLLRHDVQETDVDLVVSGMSGCKSKDQLLESLERLIFVNTPRAYFKHLCGEYCTATSFGMWLAASILKKQQIPEIVRASDHKFPDQIDTIFMINHYFNRNYSLILLNRKLEVRS